MATCINATCGVAPKCGTDYCDPQTGDCAIDICPNVAVLNDDSEMDLRGKNRAALWNEYRRLWPNRKYCMVIPKLPSIPFPYDNVSPPPNFLNEAERSNLTSVVVTDQDYGDVTNATSWYDECGLEDFVDCGHVVLFLDQTTSINGVVTASLNQFYARLAAEGLTSCTISNFDEDPITPFIDYTAIGGNGECENRP